ncbi:MAG: hypothetical protein B7Z83_03530 [Thiomonas sp. 20-64-5]|nr:MAG: hypothetical protein B7Z83_03530 [Thiomonas sp. 20-64-5]
MSSIKDKLTQSVRQARSAKTARADAVSPALARKPVAKPTAPVAKAAAQSAPNVQVSRFATEPSSSAATLFPQRVWPD